MGGTREGEGRSERIQYSELKVWVGGSGEGELDSDKRFAEFKGGG